MAIFQIEVTVRKWSKKRKTIQNKLNVHETPWSVISAILQELDMTFTVTLSMISTCAQVNEGSLKKEQEKVERQNDRSIRIKGGRNAI